MIVRVRKAGVLTTVQDRGRWGYQALGVSVAGPMDSYAHRLANAIVGNDESAATLEVTLAGPELEFTDDRLVAVTGAEFEVSVDGREVLANSLVRVAFGERLLFGRRVRGARAYIAVSGRHRYATCAREPSDACAERNGRFPWARVEIWR